MSSARWLVNRQLQGDGMQPFPGKSFAEMADPLKPLSHGARLDPVPEILARIDGTCLTALPAPFNQGAILGPNRIGTDSQNGLW